MDGFWMDNMIISLLLGPSGERSLVILVTTERCGPTMRMHYGDYSYSSGCRTSSPLEHSVGGEEVIAL